MSQQEYVEHSKLSEAKQMRKRADEDARLLSNRIALLKQEEQKAVKKIEETRRKAQEIIDARNRNLEEQRKREEIRKQREDEENERMEENRKNRERLKQIKDQTNTYRINKAYVDVQNIKNTKEKNLKTIEEMKNVDLAQKIIIKNSIKQQEREAEERRKRILDEKREKARQENEKKIEEENRLRREREEEVAKMEQEELELIQRLQNTQLLQKSAYEDLENALAGSMGFPQ
ncbi:hypothetical protein SteCoe_9972 [Stentor coeruleus]|uniref:Uncharacterized protein n=1 Tax=Stentor coeruleus TaxID=5963 RepID=A0A1R2CGM5_9CILI|nr:hypothetical protein SteCoe_9972 [Stentor coeruleus]